MSQPAADFDAAVLSPAFSCCVVSNRLLFTVANGAHLFCRNIVLLDQAGFDRVGTPFRELLIICCGAFAVGVTLDKDQIAWKVADALGGFGNFPTEFLADGIAVIGKVDVQGQLRRAAVCFDGIAFRRSRAFVEIVGDAVMIIIERAAVFIDRSPASGVRAFVQIVGNTIEITVQWAAFDIGLNSGRSFRTAIFAVDNPVTVTVERSRSDNRRRLFGRCRFFDNGLRLGGFFAELKQQAGRINQVVGILVGVDQMANISAQGEQVVEEEPFDTSAVVDDKVIIGIACCPS